MGYVIDPTQPWPKRWKDEIGSFRIITGPAEGYLMVRRPGAAPFVISVTDILARCHPILPAKKVNVRKRVEALQD